VLSCSFVVASETTKTTRRPSGRPAARSRPDSQDSSIVQASSRRRWGRRAPAPRRFRRHRTARRARGSRLHWGRLTGRRVGIVLAPGLSRDFRFFSPRMPPLPRDEGGPAGRALHINRAAGGRRILHLRVSPSRGRGRVHDPGFGASRRRRGRDGAALDGARRLGGGQSDGVRRGLLLSERSSAAAGVVLEPDPDLTRAPAPARRDLDRYAPVWSPRRAAASSPISPARAASSARRWNVAAAVQGRSASRLAPSRQRGVAVNKLVSGVAARVIRPVGSPTSSRRRGGVPPPVAVGNLRRSIAGGGKLLEDLTSTGSVSSRPSRSRAHDGLRRTREISSTGRRAGIDDTPVRPPSRAVVIEESTRRSPPGRFPRTRT